jgi:hypothetical protein
MPAMNAKFSSLMLLIALICSQTAWADVDRADLEPNDKPQADNTVAWKLSLGKYTDSVNGGANDFNLRGSDRNVSFWLAQYRDATHYTQTRTGIEQQSALPLGRLIASLQAASGGFVGASATWDLRQTDDQWVAPMLGWGRTNGATYYNLNFDPNDSVLLGATFTAPHDGLITAYRIQDDRFHTGQKVTHLAYRFRSGPTLRWTVDLFQREGRSDAQNPKFSGNGLSLALDYQRYQLKLARDPKSNFTDSNMNRVVLALRY